MRLHFLFAQLLNSSTSEHIAFVASVNHLFLAVFALSSFHVFANDYDQDTIKCDISADYSSVSSVKKKQLAKVPFDVTVKYIEKNGNVKKIVQTLISTDLIEAPRAKTVAFQTGFILDFQDLSAEESVTLLNKLGANLEDLPYGFNFKKMDLVRWFAREVRSQVHYPYYVNDGLSFHANIKCSAHGMISL
jgi:hypothetical protein